MRATMHRLAVAIATIAACSALATPSAQSFIDAANMRIAHGPEATNIALGDTVDVHLAQTLTIEKSGTAMGVFLPVSCESGSLAVRLRDKDGEFPGPAVLALGQIDAPEGGMNLKRTFTYIPFLAPAAVEARTELSLDIETLGGACTFSFSPADSDYAGGNGWIRNIYTDQTWVRLPLDITGDDLPFQLLLEPAAPSQTARPRPLPH